MSDDLVKRLRDLAQAKHDDLSIGDEAADRIAELEVRADRNAAGYARVDAKARRAEFLHKQKIAAMQKRIAELEAALHKINNKDSYSRGSYGPFAEIARAALGDGKKDG